MRRDLPDAIRLFRTNGAITISQYGAGFATYSDVATFLNACGHTRSPTLHDLRRLDATMFGLYMKFVREEFRETVKAYEAWLATGDPVRLAEVVDGLFDLQWVSKGALICTGLPQKLIWAEGAWSNLSKINVETGEVEKRADGKVLKPEGWQKPAFEEIVNAANTEGEMHPTITGLAEANRRWEEEKKNA